MQEGVDYIMCQMQSSLFCYTQVHDPRVLLAIGKMTYRHSSRLKKNYADDFAGL